MSGVPAHGMKWKNTQTLLCCTPQAEDLHYARHNLACSDYRRGISSGLLDSEDAVNTHVARREFE